MLKLAVNSVLSGLNAPGLNMCLLLKLPIMNTGWKGITLLSLTKLETSNLKWARPFIFRKCREDGTTSSGLLSLILQILSSANLGLSLLRIFSALKEI